MSAALDPLDPDDYSVLRDAADEWGKARLLDRVTDAAVSAPSLTAGSG